MSATQTVRAPARTVGISVAAPGLARATATAGATLGSSAVLAPGSSSIVTPGLSPGEAAPVPFGGTALVDTNRVLLASGPTFADHLNCFGGFDPVATAPRLLAEVEASGLSGRGGAGFADWRKLAATSQGHRPVVIANGAEGEPLSSKDVTVLTRAPHLVLDGVLAAVAATGAREAHVYAHSAALDAIRRAVSERPDATFIQFTEAPDAFIAGEATAVVSGIEKGTALPRDRITHLTTTGLGGRATLVHNVETFAHLGLIARFGARWFRQLGTAQDPGTRLLSLVGDLPNPGVREVSGGVRLSDVLRAAECDMDRVAAVLVGGYHGVWIKPENLDVVLSAGRPTQEQPKQEHLERVHPGAGVICVLDHRRCGVQATAEIISYLAGQSARQCGPCRFGLPALAEVWNELAFSGSSIQLIKRARELGASVAGRGACAHPDGTASLARSALSVFAEDLRCHNQGRCMRSGS